MTPDVSAALALAVGAEVDAFGFSWRTVFEIARKERCAPLAWFRSAGTIRRGAPDDVASAWRAEAMSAVSLAAFWQELLCETVALLEARGVDAVVLKGLPLSLQLYERAEARPCSDMDLYVPLSQRTVAHAALLDAGWIWKAGAAPYEGGYRLHHRGRFAILEVHSALLDDDLVAHLPFLPPRSEPVTLANGTVSAHRDDQLAAFLATHLAKHAMPPLLWYVDFRQYWTSLTPGQREMAWSAARSARAQRYLRWAVERVSDLERATAGDVSALRRLGFVDNRRADVHNAGRVARLAATPIDAGRVLAAWLVPRQLRSDPVAWGTLSRVRIAKAFRRAIGTRRSYLVPEQTGDAPGRVVPRSLGVDTEQLGALVGDLVSRGLHFTIRASGNSMRPAIEHGSVVCLTPRKESPVAAGDVVLAKTSAGGYMIHRVVRANSGSVQTRGDGNVRADPPIPVESVIAIADALIVDGVRRPIPNPRLARARRRLAAAVHEAWGSRGKLRGRSSVPPDAAGPTHAR